MISVDEATRHIRDTVRIQPAERVSLAEAAGRVLRSPVVADRDVPPFDRVMMDGIAVDCRALQSGRTRFAVRGEVAAGHPPIPLPDPARSCLQVMTGAVVPPGCDGVIPIEDIRIEEGHATLRAGITAAPGQFIHRRGSDRLSGDVLLHPGGRLNPARIGIAASAGCAELSVSRRPVIGIASNGDELIDVGHPVEPHQIRPSNRYALRAALLQRGFEALHAVHLPDRKAAIEEALEDLLSHCDVVVLSGGVSAGARDYIPAALDALGVRKIFHRIRQRPGKPMWFGLTRQDRPVFALPGNPVSTFVCFYRYVVPCLEQMMQAEGFTPMATLRDEMVFSPALTGLLPVRETDEADGRRMVTPVAYQGSGDLTALGPATGFVELAAGQKKFPAGSVVPYYPWS